MLDSDKSAGLLLKLFLIIILIAVVASILFLLLPGGVNNPNNNQGGLRSVDKTSIDKNRQREPIKKIDEQSIQKSLGVSYGVIIKNKIVVDNWFIAIIEPKNKKTDPGLLIYKKGDNNNIELIIGPGTSFSREQMTRREIPDNVIDNTVVKPFIRG